MTIPPPPLSPLRMVVLALTCEEPMHPYRMQTLIKQRGKDLIANVVQRNSVYQAIDALQRAGLIAVRETARDDRRPERTVYEATAAGQQALQTWVRTGLAAPAREFPAFPAALASLACLGDLQELANLLEARIEAQTMRLAEFEQSVPNVPRIFLLESDFLAA